MANFDETLKKYQEQRGELREIQGKIQTKKNEANKLNQEIDALVKKYNNRRAALVESEKLLVPLLHAEVASHPVLELKPPKVEKPVEKLAAPRPGAPREEKVSSEEPEVVPVPADEPGDGAVVSESSAK